MNNARLPRASMLLCPPDHFEVAFVINPWMSLANQVNQGLAKRQWEEFCQKLRELHVDVLLIDPVPGLADMTFAGDGGIAYRNRFVPSNFRYPKRQPEAAYFERWFADRGYQVEHVPDSAFFDGLGDVTLSYGYGIIGYGPRTSPDAIVHIERIFPDVEWLASLELVDPRFFHLGLSLQVLDGRTGIYIPDAFSPRSRALIEKLPPDMLPVSDEDAEGLAVNPVVVGRDLVVPYCSTALRSQLAERGFTVHQVDVSEFRKSGGGTRCMVLPLEYEE